jgi:hypothetical protein
MGGEVIDPSLFIPFCAYLSCTPHLNATGRAAIVILFIYQTADLAKLKMKYMAVDGGIKGPQP